MNSNPPWATAVDSGWSGETATLANCPTCRSLDTINPGLKNAVVGVSPTATFQALSENYRPPESYQWNLTVSHEIVKNTVLEASYIGNHGLHIWRRGVPANDIPPGPARLQIAQAIRNGQSTDALVAANRRLRGLGPINMAESTSNSHYKAIQLWLNRRFTDRLAFQTAYTWAHATSDGALTPYANTTDYLSDPFNYTLDNGDADLDRRHTLVANAVYVLPSFKDRSSVVSRILGDWQLNGIFSYFGALPLNVTSGVNTLGTAGANGQRPNLVTGVPIYLNTGDSTKHLNPAAFSLPGVGQLGNLKRGAIRGTSITNVDFSLNKNWRMRERYTIQFRAEVFNLFNHPNFVGFDSALDFEGNQSSANFGKVTNSNFGTLTRTQSHRELQFGLKFTF